jgi:hypothetical protein
MVFVALLLLPLLLLLLLLQGEEFLSKERARLERMIASGGVAASKVDDFARKSSVLSAFEKEQTAAE